MATPLNEGVGRGRIMTCLAVSAGRVEGRAKAAARPSALAALEARVAKLEEELAALKQRLGAA